MTARGGIFCSIVRRWNVRALQIWLTWRSVIFLYGASHDRARRQRADVRGVEVEVAHLAVGVAGARHRGLLYSMRTDQGVMVSKAAFVAACWLFFFNPRTPTAA